MNIHLCEQKQADTDLNVETCVVFIFDILFLLSELKVFWEIYSRVRTSRDETTHQFKAVVTLFHEMKRKTCITGYKNNVGN